MGICISLLRRGHPKPSGKYTVLGCIRGRLPAASGGHGSRFAQIHYPADANCKGPPLSAPFHWFRTEAIEALAVTQGISLWLAMGLLGKQRQVDPSRQPKPADNNERWPIFVFSAGLFGSCEMYTQFCRELASYGAIVVALEHEDGSGVFAKDHTSGATIKYVRPPDSAGDDAGTARFRHSFLEAHADELTAAASGIASIASGGTHASDGAVDASIVAVLRCGDPARMLLMGHSFGSSGILRYLKRLGEQSQPCPFQGALLMDTWGAPLVDEDYCALQASSAVPFAVVVSEDWREAMRTQPKASTRRLIDVGGAKCLVAVHVHGTGHQWISESQIFMPAFILRKIHIMGSSDYARALRATSRAVQFILQALLDPSAAGGLRERVKSTSDDMLTIID